MQSKVQGAMLYASNEKVQLLNNHTDCKKIQRSNKGQARMNPSYIISAPLHYQGYDEFYTDAGCMGKFIAWWDFVLHILLWVATVVIDSMIKGNGALDDMHDFQDNIQTASITCLSLALFGLVVAQIFGWLGQPVGKAWPTTVGLIVGGLLGSLLFTILLVVTFSDTLLSPDASRLRGLTLIGIALKVFTLSTLRANIEFWGACEHSAEMNQICNLTKGTVKVAPAVGVA